MRGVTGVRGEQEVKGMKGVEGTKGVEGDRGWSGMYDGEDGGYWGAGWHLIFSLAG